MVNLRRASIVVILGVTVTVAAYGGLVLILTWPVTEFSIAKAGTFGDSFGIVTSLFSGLAFAGVILTLILQRQELTESREIFRTQRFEGSFYRLLELYRRNLEDIRIVESTTDVQYVGVHALSFICKKLNSTMQKYNRFLESEEDRMVYEVQLFIEVQKLLRRQARYLGTLQNLLELIERDLNTEDDRAPYLEIIASQITSVEAKYIFYCCLVSEENDRFRELMHRSGMISTRIRNGSLSTTHRELYKRIHGVDVARTKTQLVMPYPRKQFRKIKRRAREEVRA
ncbi:putative phage abortive infection protein [Pseudoxanthomonas sp. SE1]|uniref:putative phage abortive infection protein n=1 Tax=Pseudoxanthomonas sp. SE1 TaxID=1664560 RepID=UPI00240D0E83|nr:putative phage abortive infection protein [Pseudoxanthomonas sp. SE1]WFC42280.1 hypothetical protein OY559_01690 [Pseudoxanthomonas sp. SE1]